MKNRTFDNNSMEWARDKASLSFFNPYRTFIRYYCSELKHLDIVNREIKVLDIGCGAGCVTRAIKEVFPKFNYYGIDLNKNDIKAARKNNDGIKFQVANAENLPFNSREFDIVIINSVLDHMEKPDLAVGEVFRVLKKGGIFLSSTPIEKDFSTIHGYLTRIRKFRKHRMRYLGHIHAFDINSLFELIRKPGFRIEKVNFDWFYLAQIIDVVYYQVLSAMRRRPNENVNNYIRKKKGLLSFFFNILRSTIFFVQNIESVFTYTVPAGFFVFIKAIKD